MNSCKLGFTLAKNCNILHFYTQHFQSKGLECGRLRQTVNYWKRHLQSQKSLAVLSVNSQATPCLLPYVLGDIPFSPVLLHPLVSNPPAHECLLYSIWNLWFEWKKSILPLGGNIASPSSPWGCRSSAAVGTLSWAPGTPAWYVPCSSPAWTGTLRSLCWGCLLPQDLPGQNIHVRNLILQNINIESQKCWHSIDKYLQR